MEFKQLEAFKLLVEVGSFSKVAEIMGLTQPAVSLQISNLEKELGQPLIERSHGKSQPTDMGKVLYDYAEKILSLRSHVFSAFQTSKNLTGTINIVASTIPYQYVLPIISAEFSLSFPKIMLNFTEGDSESATKAVLEEKAQFGIVGSLPHNKRVKATAILEDELVIITPNAPPYTSWKAENITIKDVLNSPFIMREQGSGTRLETEIYLNQHGYISSDLNVAEQKNTQQSVIKMVEQGRGITILSTLAAADYKRKGSVLVFPLSDNPIKRKIFLITLKDSQLTTQESAFYDFITRK